MNKEEQYKTSYYQRDNFEAWFPEGGLPRPDELAAIAYAHGRGFFNPILNPTQYTLRHPGVIYSIGCGAGSLEKRLEDMGYTVIGVDPSPGAKELYRGSTLVEEYEGGGDTIIFCESVEHLFKDQFDAIWNKIPDKAWVIFVNWPDYHPLKLDNSGYDHVRLIDDEFYDQLQEVSRVIFRRGSHLVLVKGDNK